MPAKPAIYCVVDEDLKHAFDMEVRRRRTSMQMVVHDLIEKWLKEGNAMPDKNHVPSIATTVRFPLDVRQKVEERAKKMGLSLTDAIRVAVEEWLVNTEDEMR